MGVPGSLTEMATKSKKKQAQQERAEDADTSISEVHDGTVMDLDEEDVYFQDIDLLQNHGIVRKYN